MNTIEIPVQITLPDLIKAVERLPPGDLDHFMRQARRIQKQQKGEAQLMTLIQQEMLQKDRQRLQSLSKKLESEIISEPERLELLRLVEQSEELDVKRAEALLELSQQREIPMGQLLKELKMEPERV